MTLYPQNKPIPPGTQLTHEEARARGVVAQRMREVPFEWSGKVWHLTLRPTSEQVPLQACSQEWLLALSWVGLPFELVIPHAGAQNWLRARFPDLDLPAITEPFLSAIFESLCDSLIGVLRAGAQGAVQLDRLETAGSRGCIAPHRFIVELSCDEVMLQAQLATSSQGLLWMATLIGRLPPAQNAIDAVNLPVKLFVEIGMTWLELDEISRLQVRDTILFDWCFLEEDNQLWIGFDHWGLRALRKGRDLLVTEKLTERGWTVHPSEAPELPAAPLGDLEYLPLRVVFDLGEISMTLGEIQTLQVGQPITLARPLSSAVHIRVNGALIGTGDLVEIEGELGVTVASLFQRPVIKPSRASRTGARNRVRSTPDTPEENIA
jgi:type III secretion protein Q